MGDSYDYEDDFEDDFSDAEDDSAQAQEASSVPQKKTASRQTYDMTNTATSSRMSRSSTHRLPSAGDSDTYSPTPYHKPPENVALRVASASNRRLAKIRNKLSERERELEEARREIKTQQELLRRQDKALKKYTSSEADLPRTLKRKDEEIRVLDTQLRKSKDKVKVLNETIKKRDKSMMHLKDQHRALEGIVAAKGLKSRKKLKEEVDELSELLDERDNHIRRLETLVANAKRERKRAANRNLKKDVTVDEVDKLRQEVAQLRQANSDLRKQRKVSPSKATSRATPQPGEGRTTPANASPARGSDNRDRDVSPRAAHQRAPSHAMAVSPPPPSTSKQDKQEDSCKNTTTPALSPLPPASGETHLAHQDSPSRAHAASHAGAVVSAPTVADADAGGVVEATAESGGGGTLPMRSANHDAPIVISSPTPSAHAPTTAVSQDQASSPHATSSNTATPTTTAMPELSVPTDTTWRAETLSPHAAIPSSAAPDAETTAADAASEDAARMLAEEQQRLAEEEATLQQEARQAREEAERERKRTDALLAKIAALDKAEGKEVDPTMTQVSNDDGLGRKEKKTVAAVEEEEGETVGADDGGVPLWLAESAGGTPTAARKARQANSQSRSQGVLTKRSQPSTDDDTPAWLRGNSTENAKNAAPSTSSGSQHQDKTERDPLHASPTRQHTFVVDDPRVSSSAKARQGAVLNPPSDHARGSTRRLGADNTPVLPSIPQQQAAPDASQHTSSAAESSPHVPSVLPAIGVGGRGGTDAASISGASSTSGMGVRQPAPPSAPKSTGSRTPRGARKVMRRGGAGGASLGGLNGPRRRQKGPMPWAKQPVADVEETETLTI